MDVLVGFIVIVYTLITSLYAAAQGGPKRFLHIVKAATMAYLILLIIGTQLGAPWAGDIAGLFSWVIIAMIGSVGTSALIDGLRGQRRGNTS